MRLIIFLLTLTLFSVIISASCEEGQIDINSASTEELDEIIWVGNATAEKIIANRPFNSVDELTKVSGIGDIKLADIKSQGFACVAEENTEVTEQEAEKNISNITEMQSASVIKIENSSPANIELQTINLNPKAIKSEENSQNSGKRNNAIYGLFAFGVLLGLLFLIKNFIRKKYQNEFA